MAAAALVACGSDAPAPRIRTVLQLEAVEPAVRSIEAELGGAQRYSEINVGPDFVNLFVVTDDGNEMAYVYRGGSLEAPSAPSPVVEGVSPFGLDAVALDKVVDFGRLLGKELPDAQLVRLALIDSPPVGLAWQAGMLASKGGEFQVAISPSGAIVGALAGSPGG